MSSIVDLQKETVDEFSLFDDWIARYEHLIELGKQLPAFPEEWKIDTNKVEGCQSQVWFYIRMQGDKLLIDGTSDAAIVAGLIAVMLRVYNDQTPQAIMQSSPEFVREIGFDDHLSPTRSNGLHAILKNIYQQASSLGAINSD